MSLPNYPLATERDVVLTVRVPEDADLSTLEGLTFSVRSEVDREITVPILLAGLEAVLRGQVREEYEQESPLAGADVVTEVSWLSARLMLVDLLMHTPAAGGRILDTTI